MAISPQNGKLIYHLTSLDNIESILNNGLTARSDLSTFDDVAEEEIINHRKTMGLNGYVPFHFFAGNPFDGKVQRNNSNKKFVFITVQRKFAERNNFRILIQHPLSIINNEPLSYSDGFKAINWQMMETRDYSDHTCKMICMAECLSPTVVKPNNFFNIFTATKEIKFVVEKLRDSIVGNNTFYVDDNPTLFLQ